MSSSSEQSDIEVDEMGIPIPPEAGWDDETQSTGKVMDYETGEETERREWNPMMELFSMADELTWRQASFSPPTAESQGRRERWSLQVSESLRI